MKIQKTLVSCAIAAALGMGATSASAGNVLSFELTDVGSTISDGSGGFLFSNTLDGNVGGFGFDPGGQVDPITYMLPGGAGATGFTGDGPNGGFIDVDGTAQGKFPATDSFTTGFTFGYSPFRPYLGSGGVDMDVCTSCGDLTFNSFDWVGDWETGGGTFTFPLGPDSAPTQFWAAPGGVGGNAGNVGDWLVSFAWTHVITAAEDPTTMFIGQNAQWIVEGIITPVPVPAAVWLFGSGVLGLVGVARRRKARTS